MSEIEKCIVQPPLIIDKSHIVSFCVGIDWGWSAITALVFIAMLKDWFAVVVNTIHVNQTTVPDIATIIMAEVEKYGIKKQDLNIWADAENQFNNGDLVELGFEVQPVPFGTYKAFAIGNVKRWMSSGRLKFLKSYSRSGDLFFKQMKGYKKSPETDKPEKKNDHYPDGLAAGMLCYNFLELSLSDEEHQSSEQEEERLTVQIIG
jgi:hypothetical protein